MRARAVGRKVGAAVPLCVQRELGPHLTQCRPADAYLPTKGYPDPFSRLAIIDMGRKSGEAYFQSPKNLERPQFPNDRLSAVCIVAIVAEKLYTGCRGRPAENFAL